MPIFYIPRYMNWYNNNNSGRSKSEVVQPPITNGMKNQERSQSLQHQKDQIGVDMYPNTADSDGDESGILIFC